MALLRKGSRDLIRELNHHLVLTLLRNHAPISQQKLAHLSGLSPATISSIIAELVSAGWITEVGPGTSTAQRGGRRPMLLRLNPRAGLIIGVKLMEQAITTVITDLDATILHSGEAPLDPPITAHEHPDTASVVSAMAIAIEATLETARVQRQHILGVGVGISGLVDAHTGVCHVSRIFPERRDVSLGQLLSERLDLPVSIENDVRARTIAEHSFGNGQHFQHFVLISIGRGIGAGVVVNGQLYRGAFNGAGELGHMCMDEQGPLCECGRRGCLEAMASDLAIVRRAQEAGLLVDGVPPDSITKLVQAAERGNVLARSLLADAGHLIGIGIANVVNLLSPECVFVVGEGTTSGIWRLNPLRETMWEHIFPGLKPELIVEFETISAESWAHGAACVVINNLFKSPIAV